MAVQLKGCDRGDNVREKGRKSLGMSTVNLVAFFYEEYNKVNEVNEVNGRICQQ